MITAREYRSHVAGANQQEYQSLERRIDIAISAAASLGCRDGHPIRVSVDGVSRVNVERAVSEYTCAGWLATTTTDYCDGEHIVLRSRSE